MRKFIATLAVIAATFTGGAAFAGSFDHFKPQRLPAQTDNPTKVLTRECQVPNQPNCVWYEADNYYWVNWINGDGRYCRTIFIAGQRSGGCTR